MFVLHADSPKKADGEGNIFVEKKNIHLHNHYITQNEDLWE